MVDYLTLKTGFAGSVNAERLATQAEKTVSIVDTRNRIGGNGIVCEYPQADADSYYPVPRLENSEFYNKYQALADAAPGVCFVGRLAAYRYSNTLRVVGQALTAYTHITTKRVIEFLANLNGSAYNLISWNKLARLCFSRSRCCQRQRQLC